MKEISDKKKIVDFFLDKNILVTDDAVQKIEAHHVSEIYNAIINSEDDIFVLNSNALASLKLNLDFNVSNTIENNEPEVSKNIEIEKIDTTYLEKVNIISSYSEEAKKRTVNDFVGHFNTRYKTIRSILEQRQELQGTISIGRLLHKQEKENVVVIGMISDKSFTQNNNIALTVEDPTGSVKIIVNKNNPTAFNIAKDVVLDEVIGVVGVNADKIMFANSIVQPDIPLNKELKKCPDEVYAIFLSDVHVGSNYFLKDEFNKFLQWINSEVGNDEQKEIAKKVKYIFVIGDLVDGVGIYPGQEKELEIMDIYKQYEEFVRLFSKIPKDKILIICPGNHDAVRLAEPQPKLDKNFAKAVWDLPNAMMVSNPSMIKIHTDEEFPGFDVLMYHGYSFDYYFANVDSIREQGGYDRADLLMKFLLQRRHLAPAHTSSLYLPDAFNDPLVITKIPDFFVSGHIHKAAAANYKNITIISGSCWQSTTSFQEKVGHKPEPARIPIVNLQTRQVKMLRF